PSPPRQAPTFPSRPGPPEKAKRVRPWPSSFVLATFRRHSLLAFPPRACQRLQGGEAATPRVLAPQLTPRELRRLASRRTPRAKPSAAAGTAAAPLECSRTMSLQAPIPRA